VNETQDQVTRILREFDRRQDAAEVLLPLVYEQLRAIAQNRMRQERAGHTLQATALVHEAYVKLVGGESPSWEDRGHFFRVAAEAMRRILIDHARKRKSDKRGGGRPQVPLSVVDLAADFDGEQMLALNDALDQFEAEEERAAQIVKLRFFAGLSVEETAEALGLSKRTVLREWAFARARLFQLLSDGDGAAPDDV
jgi:RNA polymerase sigma factor (TIGR02999 family)